MTDEDGNTTPQGTFGERFLAEWKMLGGPVSAWSYAEIQELRASDREGMVATLRRHHPLAEYAAIQRIRNARSPEDLARTMFAQAQAAAAANMWVMFALMS